MVWEDTNYNGIQDDGEAAYHNSKNPAVVHLQQYFYRGGKWVLENAAFRTHETKTDGTYTFSNLPTYVEKNGVRYLAGYQVLLKTMPKDYAATKYWNDADPSKVYSKLYVTDADGVEDSQRTGDLPVTVLQGNHEMLIPAREAKAGTQSNDAELYTDYNWAYVCGTNIKNIDTPNTAQQKYYDLVTARDYENLNAGLKKRNIAAVKGRIWEDTDYNGILNSGEKGKSGVSVTLEQYRYDAAVKQFVHMNNDIIVKTDAKGVYQFAKVPTHFVVDGTDQLAYYRIRAAVPAGYAVTRYRQATDDTKTDSDWIAETNYLTAPDNGDYFLTAQPAQGNAPYNLTDAVTNKEYDSILNADVTDIYNGGLKAFETGKIQGVVWFDKNYSGLQETGETAMATQQTVYLDQYYLDDTGSWKLHQTLSAKTAANTGVYQFSKQPTFVTVDGKMYLAGYRLRLNAVPDGYAVTKYQVLDPTGSCINSDLLAASQDSNTDHTVDFNQPDEYILLAKKAVHGASESKESGFHEYYVRKYDNVDYDIVTARDSDGVYNGGLKSIQTAAMDGRIWNDLNYDGTMDLSESGCGNLNLTLYQYYLDGTTWKKTAATMTAVTNSNGLYHFEGIPTYAEVGGKRYLAGYQLHLDALPDGNAVTVLANDNKLHWKNGELTLMGEQEYLIVAAEAQSFTGEHTGNTPQYNTYYDRTYSAVPNTDTIYDITESRDSKNEYRGGVRAFQTTSVSGRIWNDADYDGGMAAEEAGMEGLSMTLEQYYWDGTTWLPTAQQNYTATVNTDSNGDYHFENVPTFVEIGGERYLAGYRLKLDALPKDADGKITYGITKAGGDSKFQRLENPYQSENLYLTAPDQYLILAAEAKTETDSTYRKHYNGSDYDIADAAAQTDWNGGLKQVEKAQIVGRVWDDANYNGLQDTGEGNISGVEITLEQYYRDANGNYQPTGIFQKDSDANGEYRFDNVDTFCNANGETYLCYYQLKMTGEVPDNYTITWYRQGDDPARDSDLDAESRYLTKDTYFVCAAADTDSTDYTVDGRDILRKEDVSGYDAGFKQLAVGDISGRIWIDHNYDGMQDEADDAANTAEDKAAIENVTVKAIQYYYDGSQWQPNDTAYTASTSTDADGKYTLANLPTWVRINNMDFAAGYQLCLENLRGNYLATQYRVGTDRTKDSDLRLDSTYLTSANEYIVPAANAYDDANGNQNGASVREIPDSNGTMYAVDLACGKNTGHYDAGLKQQDKGVIRGTIWNDANYDGLYNSNEVPVATSVRVILTREIYENGNWIPDTAFGEVSEIVDHGEYQFTDLDVHVPADLSDDSTSGNKDRIYGYQIRLDLATVPDTYAVTKQYAESEQALENSFLNPRDGSLLAKDESHIILAAKATDADREHTITIAGTTYAPANLAKSVAPHNGGLTAIETASIESYIWNDENYNGIQDENEVGVATATVKLTRSYYDSRNTTWKLDDSFVLVATGTLVATATPVATGTPVATATPVATGTPTATASGGHYRFDNLPTYIEKDGQRYLVGYQMQLCEMPEGYAATKYHAAADSDKDSDLIAGTLDLQEPDTFLILAKAFSGNTPYCCQVRGVDYDIVKAADVTGYDGGIVQKDSHVSISGIVWDDADRDHQISDGESGIANVKIILRQYYRRNGKWELLPEAKQVAYTNADGQYRFDDLPLSVTVDGVTYLAGYRLWIDSIPAGYNAEEYADISSGSVEIRAEERTLDGCMILGIPEEKGVTSGTCLEGFNIAKGEDMAFLNVFLNRDPEESTETTTATDLVTTTTETAVSTESTTQTSTSASAGTTSVESSTTETSTATTQTTASTTESSTATTRTTASTSTTTSTTTARTTASTTKTSTTTTRTTAKTQSSVVTTHTTATTHTHTTATKQTTSSVTTSKQTTHSTSHTTTAKVTASPATHTIAKTTTHTTHTTSHRTTAGTTSITTQRTSVTTSRTTGTTHTTATVTTTGSTSVTTSAIHRTTSSTTQQTTATVTLSSAGPTSMTTTTHTTSQTTTQTTPKQTTVSQTNTTSVAPTSRTTSATVSTTGTTSTGTTDSSASTGTQTTHHSTHTTTQTTTVTATTVNSTCETSGASTSIRQTTLRKNHVSGDTVTTTTTAANREHAAGHHTQTTTTAADVSAQTSGTKRIPLPRQQNISGTPKTGDTTLHITILIAACGFSLLLAILTKRRKK